MVSLLYTLHLACLINLEPGVLVGDFIGQRKFITTLFTHIPRIAQGFIGTIRFLGGAIGSTALNIVINEKSAKKLPDYIAKAVLPLGLPQDRLKAFSAALAAGIPLSVPGVTPAMAAAGLVASREAWSYAFRIAFLVPIPFGVIATVVAYLVADPSRYFTQHVAIHLRTDRKDHKPRKRMAEEKSMITAMPSERLSPKGKQAGIDF